jgi:oligopeptide transport system substrate-binding protein
VDDNPPLEDMDRIKSDPVLSKELHQAPNLCTYRYGFNAKKAPLDNINVRKALASSVDRQALIDFVLKGNQKPAQTWSPPGIFGYVDGVALGIGYPYDPEAAKKYLSDAGYPGGVGLPEITLMVNTSQGHQKIAEFIGKGWQDTLGIKVNITNQEWGVYLNTCATDAPQVFRMGWCADYPDGNNWMNDVFHSGSGNNYEKYVNPTYDAIVEQAAVEVDPAKRLDLYKQAEIMICETDVAFIPIYFYTFNQLTKPYVVRTFAAIGGESWKNWDILPH